jgi:CDP-diacylglycerol--glycerol-3-phosphate 3-phosphatidyltransferase
MNVPNVLTVSRLFMAVLILILLTVSFAFSKTLALIVFVVAGISDYLDGHLARTVYGVSAFGRLMDPLTDKVMVCAAFVSFVELRLIPAWIAVIIISREFLVTGLRLLAANRGEIISAGQWGKHKTIWQIIAISALLLGLAVRHDLLRYADAALQARYDLYFGWIALGIGVAVSVITVVSGVLYFVQHRTLITT